VFDGLIEGAVRNVFDMILVWIFDRLGRSLQDLVSFLDEIHSVECDLYIHQSGIDTSTPAGKMMFQMCGVFAEFERGMIRERVKAGQARAKADGKHIGRSYKTWDRFEPERQNIIREDANRFLGTLE